MAIVHGDGKAGQYGKSNASRQLGRQMTIIATVCTVPTTLIGMLAGASFFGHTAWAHRLSVNAASWATVGVELAVFGSLRPLLRRVDRVMDKISRERLRYLRGARAEALVAWILKDLSDEWHLFNNIKLEDASDLDHVLVGPRGLYLISTKSHRGHYAVRPDGTYMLNGEPTQHVIDAQRQAMRLLDRLKGVMGTAPWIQPVLAVPFAYVGFPSMQKTAWVLHADNLSDTFEKQKPTIKPPDVERLVQTLDMIAAHSAKLFQRPPLGTQNDPQQPASRPTQSPARPPSP